MCAIKTDRGESAKRDEGLTLRPLRAVAVDTSGDSASVGAGVGLRVGSLIMGVVSSEVGGWVAPLLSVKSISDRGVDGVSVFHG